MWTIIAKARSKSRRGEGVWEYQLDCQSQQLAYGDEFNARMSRADVSTVVIGKSRADWWVLNNGWSFDNLKEQRRFSEGAGISWIEFDGLRNNLWVHVVLGSENEADAQSILDETIRHPGLYVSMTLGIGFSTVENNPMSPEPTIRRFLEGEAVFSHGEPEFSLVSRHP